MNPARIAVAALLAACGNAPGSPPAAAAPDLARHTKKLGVKGVPTILVYDKRGREVSRATSVIDGGALLQLLAKVK